MADRFGIPDVDLLAAILTYRGLHEWGLYFERKAEEQKEAMIAAQAEAEMQGASSGGPR